MGSKESTTFNPLDDGNCPHCGRHIDSIIMIDKKYVSVEISFIESLIHYEALDNKKADNFDTIFQCPYCHSFLPFKNTDEIENYLKMHQHIRE